MKDETKTQDQATAPAVDLHTMVIQAEQCWRRVEDEPPEEDIWCLVNMDGAMNCLFYNSKTKHFEDWVKMANPNVFEDAITHWMPLPEPPTDG